MRIALGLSYDGAGFSGWQTQPQGNGAQDQLERALRRFCGLSEQHAAQANTYPTEVASLATVCSGRTDAGVHALQQVVHLDAPVQRREFSWVLGLNQYLPASMAVQWAREVPPHFDARFSALRRRYRYWLLCTRVRPSLAHARVGWLHAQLAVEPMREAATLLLGEHDFSAFRSSACQAKTPVRELQAIEVRSHEPFIVFDFVANAFLHHMVRNLMGCLIQVGLAHQPPHWVRHVLESRSRQAAAPTFMPDGLYFLGADYPASFNLPAPPNPVLPLI